MQSSITLATLSYDIFRVPLCKIGNFSNVDTRIENNSSDSCISTSLFSWAFSPKICRTSARLLSRSLADWEPRDRSPSNFYGTPWEPADRTSWRSDGSGTQTRFPDIGSDRWNGHWELGNRYARQRRRRTRIIHELDVLPSQIYTACPAEADQRSSSI